MVWIPEGEKNFEDMFVRFHMIHERDRQTHTHTDYQSLCGHAPGYLVDDCQLVTDVRARKLRSADTRTLAVNRTCSSFGDRTFAAAATRVWNSLPPDMRKPDLSYGQFRRSLKTILFGQ